MKYFSLSNTIYKFIACLAKKQSVLIAEALGREANFYGLESLEAWIESLFRQRERALQTEVLVRLETATLRCDHAGGPCVRGLDIDTLLLISISSFLGCFDNYPRYMQRGNSVIQ